MFFGKRQPVGGYVAPMPDGTMMAAGMMADGMMAGAPGGPQAVSYAAPGHFMHVGPGMPGYEVGAFAAPGMAETVHATHTEMGPVYGPHYEHSEFDVDIEPRPRHHIYVVRKGDTVYKIAQMYGLDWRELAGYNRLGNPNLIYPGQRLFIPPRY